jgi:glutathione peroxidase-family protein
MNLLNAIVVIQSGQYGQYGQYGRYGLLALCLALLSCAAQAQTTLEAHSHEYAELQPAELEIKDLTFKTLDGKPLSLRELAAGHKLVLVHYFAAWCHNSNYDVETIKELYAKYKDQGFQVLAICEYSKPSELRDFIKKYQPAYPIVLESQKNKDREKTTHYAYRTSLQDKRLWGTPFNLLLNPADFRASGQIVATHAQVAFGELMKSEVEKYIRQQLNLP